MQLYKMNHIENLPFVLKYFYQDMKTVFGSITNLSAVCKKCSKTIQGNLSSTTVFESHLKSKGHEGLYEKYLNLRPQQHTETTNHPNVVDGPIVTLFKSLICNDYKQNTVLSNTQIIDILEKEFFMDVKNTHELEVQIYLNVVKKYLKDWPEWDDFEQAANNINLDDVASAELLRVNHIKLKDYLFGILEIAKFLAPEVTKKVPTPREVVPDSRSNIVMEIQATRSQLNNLILRYPRNNNMFNINEPHIEVPLQRMCLDSIINSCGVTVEMRLKYSKTQMIHLKYENSHDISHNLINKRLKKIRQVSPLKLEWQVKYRKKRAGDLPKGAILNLLKSYNLSGEKAKWWKLFASMYKILNSVTQNMPEAIDSAADYKRHLSQYSFVRYFYSEESGSSDGKYDIHLEELITPMCLLSVNFYAKEQEDSVRVHCDTCKMAFSGFSVLPDVEKHVAECHDAEPAWSCANCQETMDVARLTRMHWQHRCPGDGPVASSSMQTTHCVKYF